MRFQWYAPLILVSAASVAAGQTHSVTGVVVARGSGERLGYSIVALPALGRERFATDSGAFHFGELQAGATVLRIRRIGYTPLDTVITIGDARGDTIRIELARVALQLSGITVSAHPPCRTPGPAQIQDSALTTIINQIRMNAEQYRFLVKQYPFYYMTEVVRSSRLEKNGEMRYDAHFLRRQDARVDSKYSPGRVLARRGGVTAFQIPGLIDFADADFLDAHCFHLRGTEIVEDEVMVRVDIVAAERIKDADVNGSIYLDPGSFQVLRTVLRLSKISREISYLTDFEVTTVFREVLPSVPIIARISSVQSIDPKNRMPIDAAWETWKLIGYEFLKRKPGDDVLKAP